MISVIWTTVRPCGYSVASPPPVSSLYDSLFLLIHGRTGEQWIVTFDAAFSAQETVDSSGKIQESWVVYETAVTGLGLSVLQKLAVNLLKFKAHFCCGLIAIVRILFRGL